MVICTGAMKASRPMSSRFLNSSEKRIFLPLDWPPSVFGSVTVDSAVTRHSAAVYTGTSSSRPGASSTLPNTIPDSANDSPPARRMGPKGWFRRFSSWRMMESPMGCSDV